MKNQKIDFPYDILLKINIYIYIYLNFEHKLIYSNIFFFVSYFYFLHD